MNVGISIFRGQVLDAIFSSISIIPGLGSAIAVPLKAIFHAVDNATELTKAISSLGILFGGTKEIIPHLDEIYAGVKAFAKKIPDSITSLKNNFVAKNLIGKKKLDNIVTGIRSGINSLITRADEVIRTVKKAVKGVGKLSQNAIDNYMSKAINNPTSKKALLGITGSYDTKALNLGYTYFKMSDEVWNELVSSTKL